MSTTTTVDTVLTITRAAWEAKKRHGYTSTLNGRRHILVWVDGVGTTLVPVKVVGLSD